jgi:hypothetical protein
MRNHIQNMLLESMTFKSVLSSEEMIEFMIHNELRDAFGELDYNDIKQIARASDVWILKNLNPKHLASYALKPRKKKKRELPIIVIGDDEQGYEILDGKHRVAEANFRGDEFVLAYVGTYFS